jgi:hypothetical protein
MKSADFHEKPGQDQGKGLKSSEILPPNCSADVAMSYLRVKTGLKNPGFWSL